MHRSSRTVAGSLALTLAGLLSGANSVSAQYPPPTTQQTQAGTPPAVAPPAYTPVRWNENYAYLKDASRRADFWDPTLGAGLLAGRKFDQMLRRMLPVAAFADCHAPVRISALAVLHA